MALTVAQIDAAIEALLTGGQLYSIAGRSFTRANLKDLQELRTQVLQEESRAAGGTSAVPDFSRSSGGREASEWGD